MPRAKKAVAKKTVKKATKKAPKRAIASKNVSKKKKVIIKKEKGNNDNIFIKLLIVLVVASLLLLSLVHLMSKATIRTKTWESTYKNYPELLNKNSQSGDGFFSEFLKENSIAADDSNFKIFKELKNYDNSKRAILFGEKTDKEARGIFIMDNKENRAGEFKYLENQKYDYLSNVIWMDGNRLAYDKMIVNEDGLIPERHILGKIKRNSLPEFLNWSNYEASPITKLNVEEMGNSELSNYLIQISDEIRTYNYNDYTLLIAPNINNWTAEEYNELSKEYTGEMMRLPLLGVVNDGELLVWGDRCSGYGVKLMEDQVGYEEQQNCFKAEEEILKYFK